MDGMQGHVGMNTSWGFEYAISKHCCNMEGHSGPTVQGLPVGFRV